MLTNHKDRRKRFCFYLRKLTIAPINFSPRGFDFFCAYESVPIRVIYDFRKMKIDTKAVNVLSKSDTLAILPLESKPVKYTRAQTALFKCRTTPTQADSPTYEVVIKILDGSETLREAITWNKQVEMLRNGLSLDLSWRFLERRNSGKPQNRQGIPEKGGITDLQELRHSGWTPQNGVSGKLQQDFPAISWK